MALRQSLRIFATSSAGMPAALRPVRLLVSATRVAGLLWAGAASAQVMQPTGEVMPTATKQAEIDVVTSRGFPADAVTLDGLFKYRNEPLDPVMDAQIEPGVFSPLCGFTGTLLLRGGSCKVAFGWYNVTPGSTTPPPDNQIYELVPADTSIAFQCHTQDFCPLATMETTQPQNTWTPMTFSADNIRSDMRYRGGLVGFALKGDGVQCSQSKFSEAELNVKRMGGAGEPWITTLIYPSVATPDAYYVAFEDLPVSPMTWKGANNGNDGDFNDFVYFITGLTCEGGGQLCDAAATNPALTGVCAVGRTGCSTGGAAPACNPIVQPTAERCDNLDNDCNGTVDDGDLCPPRQVCDRGTCVQSCTGGEFQCPPTLECNNNGFCVERSCKDLVCEAGQVCRGGVCSGGCGPEVKCPVGHECQLGRCIDPCKDAKCADNQICQQGVCVANCNCRPCGTGKACAEMGPEKGHCVDSGCETKTCGDGMLCIAGNCVDACEGVVCPGNAKCVNGECGDPLPDAAMGGKGGGGTIVIPPISTGGASSIPNPSGGRGSTPPLGTAGTAAPTRNAPESGCGCRVPGRSSAPSWLGLGGLAALAGLYRTRRRRDRSARP